MTSVSEAEILEAQAMLRELEGIEDGYCGSATVAAVIKMAARGVIGSRQTVLLNLTD